jgi:hypothetical protein
MYKDKIELLLDLNKKLTQEREFNIPENAYNESYINTNEEFKQNNEYIPDVVENYIEVAEVDETDVDVEVAEVEVDETDVDVEVAEVEVDEVEVAEVEVAEVEVAEVEVDETEVDETEVEVAEVDEVEVDETEVEVAEVDETEVDETEVEVAEVDIVDDNGSIDTEVDNGSIDISNIDLDIDNILNDISINKSEEYEVLNNKKKELFDIYIDKSVKELREILMEKNLPLSGNKTKQVHRILDNL